MQTEVEDKILEKYSPRSRDKNPGACGKGKCRCWQHRAGITVLPRQLEKELLVVTVGEDAFPVLQQVGVQEAGGVWLSGEPLI